MRNGKRQRCSRRNNIRIKYRDFDSVFFTGREPLLYRGRRFVYSDTDDPCAPPVFEIEAILPKVYEGRRRDGSTFKFCVSAPQPSKGSK